MQERYENLDGLRAFSAIGIVAMHVLENSSEFVISDSVFNIIASLKWLVYLFMILSGFSMCCGYYDKIIKSEIDICEFYIRRYLKILPFFSFLVIIDCVSNLNVNTIIEAISDLTLVFGFLPNANISVIGVGWFLGVVFVFYLIFPFFIFCMRSKQSAIITLILAVFYNICTQFYFFDTNHVVSNFNKHTSFVFCSMFFCAGGVIYIYRETLIEFFRKRKTVCLPITIIITILFSLYNKNIPETLEPLGYLMLFSSWIVSAIAYDSFVFNNMIVRKVSKLSLEIYLSHMLIFRILQKLNCLYLFGNGIVAFFEIVVIVIVGTLCFCYVSIKIGKFMGKIIYELIFCKEVLE